MINLVETQNRWLAVDTRERVLGYHTQAQRGLATLDNQTVISVYRVMRRVRAQLIQRLAGFTTPQFRTAFNQTFVGWDLDPNLWTTFLASFQQVHGTDVPTFIALCQANAGTISEQSEMGNDDDAAAVYASPLSDPAQTALRNQLESALQAIVDNYS